jgi:hypothetical protein
MNEKEAAESICDIIRTTGENGQTMMTEALALFFDKEFGSKNERKDWPTQKRRDGSKFPKAKYGLLDSCRRVSRERRAAAGNNALTGTRQERRAPSPDEAGDSAISEDAVNAQGQMRRPQCGVRSLASGQTCVARP